MKKRETYVGHVTKHGDTEISGKDRGLETETGSGEDDSTSESIDDRIAYSVSLYSG